MNFTISKLKKAEDKKIGCKRKQPMTSSDSSIEPLVYHSIKKCYFWHEGEGNWGADEIESCVLKFFAKELINYKGDDSLDLVFYSDNCCGQNKNKYIVGVYMYAIIKYDKLNSITHKFFVPGHTKNEGDSIPSVIEKQIVFVEIRSNLHSESVGIDN